MSLNSKSQNKNEVKGALQFGWVAEIGWTDSLKFFVRVSHSEITYPSAQLSAFYIGFLTFLCCFPSFKTQLSTWQEKKKLEHLIQANYFRLHLCALKFSSSQFQFRCLPWTFLLHISAGHVFTFWVPSPPLELRIVLIHSTGSSEIFRRAWTRHNLAASNLMWKYPMLSVQFHSLFLLSCGFLRNSMLLRGVFFNFVMLFLCLFWHRLTWGVLFWQFQQCSSQKKKSALLRKNNNLLLFLNPWISEVVLFSCFIRS